jgi:glycosyltransferase involved in cell wall biosynthesis
MASERRLQKHFVFTGLVPPSDIPALAGIMDALVHLSFREGLPRALPQALAAGKPVVAYDCDGAGEVCITGKTGFLVGRRDFPALLDALRTIVSDVELRKRMGESGREFVRERFAVERMVADTHQLYLRLLREGGFLPAAAA